MSLDIGLVDDFQGQNVVVVGMKPIAKILAAFEPAFILKNINIIIEANLADIVIAARGKARKRSGFMLESIDYQMGNMTGFAFAGAPYSFAQEKGFTTPTGGRVSANNFFMPSAFNGMRQYVADLQLFFSNIIKGGSFAGRAIKSVVRGSVTRAISSSSGAGRGVHKYTSKIALGGGKFRYVYPSSGQSSRFTKVFKPGTGKGFGGVGRKRRTV
jgi:hypothetical protein